jgi:hypothetical protein
LILLSYLYTFDLYHLQGGPSGSRLGTMFLEASNGTRKEVCFKMLGIPRKLNPSGPNASQQQQQQQQQDVSSISSSSSSSSQNGRDASAAPGAMSTIGNIPATATQYGYSPLNRAEPWSVNPGVYSAVQGTWDFRLVNLRFILIPWVKDPPWDGCCREYHPDSAAASIGLEIAPFASTGAEAARITRASAAAAAAAASTVGAGTAQLTTPQQLQWQASSSVRDGDSAPVGISDVVAQAVLAGTAAAPERYSYFNATPAMVEMEKDVRAAVRRVRSQAAAGIGSSSSSGLRGAASFASYIGGSSMPKSSSSSSSSAAQSLNSKPIAQQAWQVLKERYQYADGQFVFDSLYRPCYADTKGTCVETCG